jgi:hypothetical protein
MGFTKLFSEIVCSSIWNEDDKTRLVWITLLAIKDGTHVARATIGGLAHQARVSVEDCRRAVQKLSNPDPDGLDQPYEGRRIKLVDHGFLVLNGEFYKKRRDDEDRKEYQAEWARNDRVKKRLQNVDKSVDKFVDASTPSTNIDPIQIRSDQNQIRSELIHIAPSAAPKRSRKKTIPVSDNPPNADEFTEYCKSRALKDKDIGYLWNNC